MIQTSGTRRRVMHPTDGDIVRLLDGVNDSDRERVAAHVRSCAMCMPRVERLRRRSANLSSLLQESATIAWLPAYPEARPRRTDRHRVHVMGWRRFGYAAAATVLFGVVAENPLRAWITSELRRVVERAPVKRAVPAPLGIEERSVSVTFPSETRELVFWLDAAPIAGTLEVRTSAAQSPTAEVIDGRAREELIVMPDGIRVQNDARSVARYRLTVPASIRRLRVRVGERGLDTLLTVSAMGSRLDLRSAAARR